jgi:HEAT repeat protein
MASARDVQRSLEGLTLSPEEALTLLCETARGAATLTHRLDACRVLGAIAGRAFEATWEVAEQAAFELLEIARRADAAPERAGVLLAMARAVRNLWLLPYVHRRLSDDDALVASAAISAAGGLGFPALEESLAPFLAREANAPLRRSAMAALGRMGAESMAPRLLSFISADPSDAVVALGALTEMRSRAGVSAALERLARSPPRSVLLALLRYLSELGEPGILPTLRRLARDDDAELRLAAGLASRAYKAETTSPADERILTALTERDRAVRASLARRLRTLPVADVLAQAEILLPDDPAGIVQVIAEVRAPEVTRMLLRIADDSTIPMATRARAVGAIEADEPWEREALVGLIRAPNDEAIRAAAAQALGAFAPLADVLEFVVPEWEHATSVLRAAILWALQLAGRTSNDASLERQVARIVSVALSDVDASVRKRAAYVAGNLDLTETVPDLVRLAREQDDRPDQRVATFVALAEIGSRAKLSDLVFLWNREDDPRALGALARAIERAVLDTPADAEAALTRTADRLPKLLGSSDAELRGAALRVAGLCPSVITLASLALLLEDEAPRVREQAVAALGRRDARESVPLLARALDDADEGIQERAAMALLGLGDAAGVCHALQFVAKTSDRHAAARVASQLTPAMMKGEGVASALADAVGRVDGSDPTYEMLLALRVAELERGRPADESAPSVDAAIGALFPTWPRLSAIRGFLPLAKSLRTAELLFRSIDSGGDVDFAAAIVLWMKCLEGYLDAWLGPKMRVLEETSHGFRETTDRLLGPSWPAYQRYVQVRWADPVEVGALRVEVPLRACLNVLKDIEDRRRRPNDGPQSVTTWSRLMLFFAIDHPSGPKNLLQVASTEPERMVRLAHRLSVLAVVRNAVTHRAVAEASTLQTFRRLYYATFEELVAMAR